MNAPVDGVVTKGTMNDQKINYGTATALSKNVFTVTGYTFLGWSKTPYATRTDGMTVEQKALYNADPSADVVYTNSQKVTSLDDNGGTIQMYAVWKLK